MRSEICRYEMPVSKLRHLICRLLIAYVALVLFVHRSGILPVRDEVGGGEVVEKRQSVHDGGASLQKREMCEYSSRMRLDTRKGSRALTSSRATIGRPPAPRMSASLAFFSSWACRPIAASAPAYSSAEIRAISTRRSFAACKCISANSTAKVSATCCGSEIPA